jgi:DNA-directed RNA polymerase specialized sigma24 family protein
VAAARWEFDAFVVAYMLTRDMGLAEDLVQIALTKAHRRWRTSGGADSPDAYVRRIVVNEHTSWRRRRSNTEILIAAQRQLVTNGQMRSPSETWFGAPSRS